MSRVVLDASAALSWLLKTQATAASTAMLRRIETFDFAAPFVFDWEVQNVLLSAGRHDHDLYRATLAQLARFDVVLEEPFPVTAVMSIAARRGLSLFDAAYLKLAVESELPLMSRDGRLVDAAKAAGVTTYDLR